MTDQLVGIARELTETQREVIGILALDSEAWKWDRVPELLASYDDARRRLRQLVGDDSVVTLPDPGHAAARGVLQQALLGDLPLDRLLASGRSGNAPSFTTEELEPLAEQMLTWFSQYTYAQNRLSGAVLVLNAGSFGGHAAEFVGEIVECFAFEQYTAVYALCRTALEASLRPVYQAHGLADPDSANSHRVGERVWRQRYPDPKKDRYTHARRLYTDDFSPDLDQMITRLCWLDEFSQATVPGGPTGAEPLRHVLHRVRDHGNSLIHARRTATKESARTMMRDLFAALHVVYETGAPPDVRSGDAPDAAPLA